MLTYYSSSSFYSSPVTSNSNSSVTISTMTVLTIFTTLLQPQPTLPHFFLFHHQPAPPLLRQRTNILFTMLEKSLLPCYSVPQPETHLFPSPANSPASFFQCWRTDSTPNLDTLCPNLKPTCLPPLLMHHHPFPNTREQPYPSLATLCPKMSALAGTKKSSKALLFSEVKNLQGLWPHSCATLLESAEKSLVYGSAVDGEEMGGCFILKKMKGKWRRRDGERGGLSF